MTEIRKILHVIPSVAAVHGGPSVMVGMMTRGLAQAGIEVHVATTNDDGAGRLNVPCGVPVERDGLTYWYFNRQLSFYKYSRPLSQWLSRHVGDYQLVHIHAFFSHSSCAAARRARQQGVPYIVRPLGVLNRWGMENRRPWLKKLSLRFLERPIVDGAALMHYTSEQERYEASLLGVRTRSEVIPNPVPSAAVAGSRACFFARHPELTGRPVILFLSRIDRKKGLELLLPAFARVRARFPAAALVIAGSGDEVLIRELRGQMNDIVWTGFVAGEYKADAFAAADVFVLPSWSENFGVAVVEAMAAGCPVVVTDQVAVHTDIAAAGAGLVVPCDPNAIALALCRVLEDGSARETMGTNGQHLTRTHFSPEAVTSRLLAAYRSILN